MQITNDARIEILKDSEERPLLVLESRQMTAIAFGAVMLVGILACSAYVVGRLLPSHPEAPAAQVAVVHKKAPRPAETPRPVEPAPPVTQAVVAPAPPPVVAQAVAPKASPAIPAPTPVQPASAMVEPAKGQSFLQVGSIAPDTAQPFLANLAAKGFKGKLAPGADSRTVRVLVGPLPKADLTAVSADLTQAGFANFPKFY